MDHTPRTVIDRINEGLPEGFTAYENIDLGPAAFHIYVEDGYGIYFTFAAGFNTDGWEVVLDIAGDYTQWARALPDGPEADAADEALAKWAIDIIKSYASRGEQSREDWAATLFRCTVGTDCPHHPGTDHESYDNRTDFEKETARPYLRPGKEVNVDTYKIVRFFSDDRPRQTRKTGLSLEEAQAHCNDPDTRKDGEWFDGYESE
jgi:hypothetical protein